MSDPWLSIEVLDGEVPASDWRRTYSDALRKAAITDRAVRWSWRTHERGVVFEIAFTTEAIRDEFCDQPSVRTALGAVPDPRHGITIASGS
ncbi:hypothetical protein G3I59_14600 [Amycolatopsis rubida]|uniref:DUF4242 domain-containing protein n=1 Tax=Amycolatopsis rubida TaxID=112413 RepID=A0A1I6AWY1_9PSEU|nr:MULTISPECIES: hypothetical protein [Amycolatopsis]MYW91791.1 hypothetical protein [Amycolatopsis rubida]NEC56776.1 hypothetical protein [Amycolatopsis rubida]OAP21718.1 hypothetical protein A4R44_07511 [Amycolatopsis sp. M39]SFQ73143.1 hypothetical protein SAMN05421854_12173 [Amycolatopsis rubida]